MKKTPLTIEQVENARLRLPGHRADLDYRAKSIIRMLKRGITVRESAPAWTQISNAAFAASIDSGDTSPDGRV